MTKSLKLHITIVFILITSSFLNCSENAITNDGQRQHLVIVLDGLRPDYITNELMPNLYRLGQEGVVGENHHVAYPTVTRVNSPSIATGAYPGTHGLMHNQIYLPEISDESIHTGDDVDIMMGVDPLLTATSLGELLERHDLTIFSASSGSYGTSYLMNHTIAGAGIWNSRGFFAPEQNKEQVLGTFGELPEITRPNYGQNRWVVDTYLTFAVDTYQADVATLWITDPDRTAHHFGIGAPETRVALRHVDDELGRLLNGLRDRGLIDHTNIFITTDHGFSTHTGGFDVSGILEENDLLEGVRIIGNTQIYVSDQDPQRIQRIVRVLQQDSSVGAIFTRPGEDGGADGWVKGTMSMDLIHYNHSRAADILVTASWDDEQNEHGYAGTSTQGGTAGHGTSSPYELQVNLIASGPDFKSNIVSPVPSGNVDIAPTILHLLDISIPETMSGRILEELLVDGPDPVSVEVQIERYETTPVEWDENFKMILEKASTGESAYFQKAWIIR
jgi:predicted AlkP superfamily pyrophosphatase or phosphodiesterase